MSDSESGTSAGPRLVLCLMVKNEERIIERCLRSVLPHIHAVVLCHNGTDSTVAKATALLDDWCRDGVRLYHLEAQPWVNFGVSRTRSFEATKRFVAVERPRWPLDDTYALFLDADMELVVEPGFDRRTLTAPGYRLLQQNHGELYNNLRLARLSHDWRSVGVTHEYWAPTPDFGEPATLPKSALWIRDHDDGGSKSDKLSRDILALEQGLVEEPGNVRYMFYLARSYADGGQHEKAVEMYRKRQAAGGWDQEVWYSRYREGLSLLTLGREAEGVGTLVAAYQLRPWRAEPLVNLAQHFRAQGKNHIAFLFARQASKIPVPPPEELFVWTDAHLSAARREMAVTAYYTGDTEEGIATAEALVGEYGHAYDLYQHMLQTLSFYVKPLLPLALRAGKLGVSDASRTAPGPFLGGPNPNTTEYLPKNPAIVSYRGLTLVNVNLVNYHHDRGVVFAPKDADGIVRTRNVVAEWGGANGREVTPDAWPITWHPDVPIRGLEDQRWVVWGGRVHFTATCFHPNGRPEVVFGFMNDDVTRVEKMMTLSYDGAQACEKNWVPWRFYEKVVTTGSGRWHEQEDGRLLLIYGFEPLTLLEVDQLGRCTVFSQQPSPVNASSWRGGAPPILSPWGRYVTIVHVVAHHADRRTYMHRWVEFSPFEGGGVRVTSWSKLFALDHVGVEYATGMLVSGIDQFLVAYGSEEREARWMEFDWNTVKQLLTEKGSL